jgi:hypothetical protein
MAKTAKPKKTIRRRHKNRDSQLAASSTQGLILLNFSYNCCFSQKRRIISILAIPFNTDRGQHIIKNPGVVNAIVEKV